MDILMLNEIEVQRLLALGYRAMHIS
jgi:hypothetical protein